MLSALYVTSVWLHIMAAMTWLGGLLMFVITVLPWVRTLDDVRRSEFRQAFGRRLMMLTWSAFITLALTGTFNLWFRGVALTDFLRPEWRASATGRLIVIKLILVLATMAGCLTHQLARDQARAKWAGRVVLVLGLLIVAVAVRLVRHI